MKLRIAASYGLLFAVFVVIATVGQPRLASQTLSSQPRFDTEKALEHLRALDALTRDGGGRAAGTRGHHDVIEYVAHAFRDAGLTSRIERFGDSLSGSNLINVLAELPGSNEEIVILGAHHDSLGGGPAVVDGMTGIAVLLESARALRESRQRLQAGWQAGGSSQRTILFVSWDGESFGCAGSTDFVRRYGEETLRRVRAVISLDSLGWKDGVPVIHNPRYYDRFGDSHIAPDWLVWKVARSATRAGVTAPVGDRYLSLPYQVVTRLIDLGYYSDERPFVLAGVPGLFVSDFSLSHFYPHYGSPLDTMEQVGAEPLDHAGRIVTAAMRDLADSDVLPAGEAEYLMAPTPWGWIRLTGDHLRLLAALLTLPGLLAFAGKSATPSGKILLVLHGVFIAIFLGEVLKVDAVVFVMIAGPALVASPLLIIRRKEAIYGFLASLIPPIICSALMVEVLRGGSRQLTLGPWGTFGVLGITLLGASMAATAGLASRLPGRFRVESRAGDQI